MAAAIHLGCSSTASAAWRRASTCSSGTARPTTASGPPARRVPWARPPAARTICRCSSWPRRDLRDVGRVVSCHQEIAADGAFSLGMLADFGETIRERGAWWYRRLFWEAGVLGQVLYLEAEAAGVRGTGIGCYFDDAFHDLLGLAGDRFQDLYHFTVGGPVDDPRLTTLPPYAHLERRRGPMPRETRRLMTSRTRARTSRPGQAVPTCPESARPRGESGAEARESTGRSGLGPGASGRWTARRPPRGVPWAGGERLDMVRPEDLIHPRDEIMRTMERIYRYRMTTTSGGNLSIRDDDGTIWITPARVDKGSLRRDDIVRVRPDGAAEGRHRPSSEFPFHRAIYAARPDLRAIVHAHPVALVAFSICRRVPDTRLLPRPGGSAARSASPPTPCPAARRWAETSPGRSPPGSSCVVLENHGVVTGGGGTPAGVRAVRDAGVRRQDHHQGRHAGHGPVPDRRAGRAAAAGDRDPAAAPPGAGDERGEGAAAAALRVRPPRLSAAADDQHPGGLLGPARRRVVPDHAPPGRPQRRSTLADIVLVRRRRPGAGQDAQQPPRSTTGRSTRPTPRSRPSSTPTRSTPRPSA